MHENKLPLASGFVVFGLLLVTIPVIYGLSLWLPPACDWEGTFYPVALKVTTLQSPYENPYYKYVPWAVVPLIPFALDETIGRAALFVVSVLVYAGVAVRLGARPLAMALFLISPPVLQTLISSNLEWLVFASFFLPPSLGMFGVLIKPQVGIGVAMLWVAEAWRLGGILRVVRITAPVTTALLLSFALYGFWPANSVDTIGYEHNVSFWPWGLPVGIILLLLSIRLRGLRPAIAAAPFLSPYLMLQSYAGVLLAVVNRTLILGLLVTGMWALALLPFIL
ncbi:MAG: hypothetical protein GXY36_00075 [Chloroflexi bacterium]|nr:hypothetical protein [Chloroflexota bacterium]